MKAYRKRSYRAPGIVNLKSRR